MSVGAPYVYRFISLIYDPQKISSYQQSPIPKYHWVYIYRAQLTNQLLYVIIC